jgi:hypothetical protein
MKRKILIAVAFLMLAGYSFGQIYTPSGVIAGSSGSTTNVGIGIATPTSALHVIASGSQATSYTGSKFLNTSILGVSPLNPLTKVGLEISSTGQWGDPHASVHNNNIGLYVSAVSGAVNNYDAIFNGGGNVGIATTSPEQKLVVKGAISIYNPDEDGNIALFFGREHAANIYGKWGIQYVHAGEIGASSLPGLNFWIPNSGNNYLFLADNGNVLIGKNLQVNTAYKLDVNGAVRANEVDVNTTGADFVFEKDYSLMSLSDLEKSIQKNKHLPGVPSASEMQKNGMSLGETNTVLLQKVEELTLYMIEQNKKIDNLQKDNESLKNEVELIKNK